MSTQNNLVTPSVNNEITADTKVMFTDLAQVFSGFDLFTTTYHDQQIIGRGLAMYEMEKGIQFLNVQMEYIAAYGNTLYTKCQHNVIIPAYMGKVSIESLPVQPLFDLDGIDKFVVRVDTSHH